MGTGVTAIYLYAHGAAESAQLEWIKCDTERRRRKPRSKTSGLAAYYKARKRKE